MADLVFGQVLKYALVNSANETAIVKTSVKAYPNPTTDQVNIAYELTQTAPVTVEIFDLTGRRVAQFNEGNQSPGAYTIRWDGTNGSGQKADSGMYVYRLTAGSGLTSGLLHMTR